jgi:hypothetical protein
MQVITDPFHRMVFAARTASRYISRLFVPASRPIQPSGIPSLSVATPVWWEEPVREMPGACKKHSHIGIFVKFVRSDIIYRENELNVIFPSLFDESANVLGASCIK